MLRRLCAVASVAIVLTVAVVGTAQAKGPMSAVVSGPGILSTTVVYTQRAGDIDLDELSNATRLYDVWLGLNHDQITHAAPAGKLGPKYTVVYDFSGDGQTMLTQELYPIAATGPLVYTPPGQQFWSEPLLSGWVNGSADLVSALRGLGARLPPLRELGARLTPPRQANGYAVTTPEDPTTKMVQSYAAAERAREGSSEDVAVVPWIAWAGGVALLAGLVTAYLRRRPTAERWRAR